MRRFYEGASIMGFQIQVPQYPSMAVSANVRFRAKTNSSFFASLWNGHKTLAKLDTDVFLGLDINRLDCPQTITPVLVRNAKGVSEIKSSDDLRTWDLNIDSWSTLTDLCSYEVDNIQLTPKAYKYIGLNKRGAIPKTKLIEPAREFREKILSSVFIKEGNAWKRTEPTESIPYDVDNPSNEEKIDFLDEVGALMKYWGHKHSHLHRAHN